MKKSFSRLVHCCLGAGIAAGILFSLTGCKTKNPPSYTGVMGSRGAVPPPLAAREARAARRAPELPAPGSREPLAPLVPAKPAEPSFVPAQSGMTTPGVVSKPAARPAAPAGAAVAGTHVMKPKETLSKVAKDNGTTVAAIMAVNPQIEASNKVKAGQRINLPGAAHASAQSAKKPAAKSAKGALKPSAPAVAGGMALPPDPPATPAGITSEKAPKGAAKTTAKPGRNPLPDDGIYTVEANDSLWTVSRRYGVSMDNLRKWNNLKTDNLRKGQKLKLREDAVVPAKKEAAAKPAAGAKPGKKAVAAKGGEAGPVKPEKSAAPAKKEGAPAAAAPAAKGAAEPAAKVDPPAAAAPAAAKPAGNVRTFDYSVFAGDSLEKIAADLSVTVDDILRYNPHVKGNADLKDGVSLQIPYKD